MRFFTKIPAPVPLAPIQSYLAPLPITAEQAQAEIDKLMAPDTKTTAVAIRDVSPNSVYGLDSTINQVYKIIAGGDVVINLHDTISNAGFNGRFLPNLALARANATTIQCTRSENGRLTFTIFPHENSYGNHYYDQTHRVPPFDDRVSSISATAVVPLIPKGLRPDNLNDFSILFEPVWSDPRVTLKPVPVRVVDPILLRKISGMLYEVIAYWDVSPIEAAVLRGLV